MTWLSRLLPPKTTLQRLANSSHDRRARQGRKRRQIANLENLESRALLAGIVTFNPIPVGGEVDIVTVGSPKFQVVERADGLLTVQALPGNPSTIINGIPGGSQPTLLPVTNILITINGGNTSVVTLDMTGVSPTVKNVAIVVPGVSPTATGANLTLNVHDKQDAGNFAVYDSPTNGAFPSLPAGNGFPGGSNPGGFYPNATGPIFVGGLVTGTAAVGAPAANNLGGTLTASIVRSQFGSLTIEQDGCCPANVTLDRDIITGRVQIYEGIANNDTINISNSWLGATTLVQYFGPRVGVDVEHGVCVGSGDRISVNDTLPGRQIFSLDTHQFGPGGGQQILIGTTSDVQVALTGPGIFAEQPNAGGGDTIHVEFITTAGRPSNTLGNGPPSIVTRQGNGNNETTIVDAVTIPGNIDIRQGNGNNDLVHTADNVIGFFQRIGPFIQEFYGFLYILQGNGAGDIVRNDSDSSEPTVNPAGSVYNNVLIQQGNGGGATSGCIGFPNFTDVVTFNEATVISDLWILQNRAAVIPFLQISGVTLIQDPGPGGPGQDGTGVGFNLIQIGNTTPVSVGARTYLFQGGSNNEVDLGGADGPTGIDFETTYLDIWTGNGGLAFVTATDTVVDIGSWYGLNYVINGGDGGNVYLNGVGNFPSPLPTNNFFNF
jgi:hypothetical protein